MPYIKRGHAHIRTVVLAVSSLALVVVCFAVYQYSESGNNPLDVTQVTPAPPAATPPAPAPTPTPTPTAKQHATPTPKPESSDDAAGTRKPADENPQQPQEEEASASLMVGKERIPITHGERASLTIYGDDGRPRGQLTVDEWKPIGRKGDEVEVVNPEIRIRTPDGQRIKVTADTGRIVTKIIRGRGQTPKSGRLIGNVSILVDRLSQEQREALPEDQRERIDPYRKIDLKMDDILFDLEFSRIECSGNFSLRAAEAAVEGFGLSLRYSELDARVEDLVIEQGRRIEVRGAAARLAGRFRTGTAITVSQDEVEEEKAAKQAPAPTPESQDPNALPALPADDGKPRKKIRPTDTYEATFRDDIVVTQFVGDEPIGSLQGAELLEILFDFGQKERELTKRVPSSGKDVEPIGTLGEQEASDTGDEDEQLVVMTWNGPLKVRAVPREEQETSPTAKRRVHLSAEGDMTIQESSRRIECRRFVYRDETRKIELYGVAEDPATVWSEDFGELTAVEMSLDPTAGTAHAKGPGRLLSFRSPTLPDAESVSDEQAKESSTVAFDVTFGHEVNASFGQTTVTKLDPATGESTETSRQVLEQASFDGSVKMVHGEEQISCDRIDLEFGVDPNGKQYPKQVVATRDVVAAKGERRISAKDKMIVDIQLRELEQHAFDLVRARQVAVDKGLDPDTIDWQKVQAEHEVKRRFRPALQRIQAYGDVDVSDPQQKLQLTAATLDCDFDEEQKIQTGSLTAKRGETAFIGLGEFSVAAKRSIRFDAVKQEVRVPAPGKMTFPAQQDLSGRTVEDPVLVSVNWDERMEYSGTDNAAVFYGKVHAEGADSSFDCGERLRVEFTDKPVEAEPEEKDSKWWVFSELVDPSEEDGDVVSLAGSRSGKQPTLLYATGGVVALTSNIDKKTDLLTTRARLSGATLAVNLVDQFMRIEGAGDLLIEDYRLATGAEDKKTENAEPSRVSPFGTVSREEPSQTFVSWKESMTHRWGINVAQVEGDVQIRHYTGTKMVLVDELVAQRGLSAPTSGREATLGCDSLLLKFLRVEDKKAAGIGKISGNEIDAFNASGHVYFADSGISALADRVTYSREDALLQILGTGDADVELFDQRNGFTYLTGKKFTWNPRTKRITAHQSHGVRH